MKERKERKKERKKKKKKKKKKRIKITQKWSGRISDLCQVS